MVQVPQRENVQTRLRDRGIETLIHYPIANHKQEAYTEYVNRSLPLTERLADTVLSLPMGPHLSQANVDEVGQALADALRTLAWARARASARSQPLGQLDRREGALRCRPKPPSLYVK